MIKENLAKINASLADGVRLIAVSKTKPVEDLQEAYDAGQRLFGENKALEMRDKHAVLPEDIEWHFIGHLQTNKIIHYNAEYIIILLPDYLFSFQNTGMTEVLLYYPSKEVYNKSTKA